MAITTHDTETEVQDRAILVSLVTDKIKRTGIDPELSLQELVQLAETAGVEVLDVLRQNKETPDSRWFIGKGKVEELRMAADGLGANTAIFDQELSGAQVRNLEEALDLKIIDRTQLILDIFAGRAKTREGIIQVELAQLSYLLPRLSGQGKNLSRQGGGIGTRGPGESKLETDRRHIRDRITELKRQLDEVVKTRELHREHRRKSGAVQVALVGYTNAGKSTLLKQLTDADVYIENQLFATLDPTSRVLQLPGGKEVVLTDTVGFIQNLPHDLVASFRATLEEVNEANLVLHVVDSSSPMREEQMEVVQTILQDLGAAGKPQVVLFNKIDLCQPEQLEMLPTGEGFLKISAFNEDDLSRITEIISDQLAGDTLIFRIPGDRGDLSSLLYRVGEVLEPDYDGSDVLYNVRLNKEDYDKWSYKLAEFVEPQ
ncbi:MULTISPECIES: GTPase HflX [unclassified Paenibacillus]|uniref:GTPase HflX n=1 Tax=unclassified Paenibacillus TaxID=185978 RepID=UPI0003E26854|nr:MULTISPECIES: GTPase HflX [unclassified Paenibacillus]ETT48391.1 GTP-binding protein HflX [Paenibacillus sp. FSL R7-269]OMF93661.1 GTPase HflX [Paenibacillus sp. FSL R7-0337]